MLLLISVFNSSSVTPCIVSTCSNSSPTSSLIFSSSASTSLSETSYLSSSTFNVTSFFNASSPLVATISSYSSSFVTFPAFVSATFSDEPPQAVSPSSPNDIAATAINFFIFGTLLNLYNLAKLVICFSTNKN